MKKLLTILLTGILLSAAVFADTRPERPGPPPPPGRKGGVHPLLSALESKEFTDTERKELRQLAAKDPRMFEREMRTHFFKWRQKKAKRLLALRAAYLEAKTPELKETALAKIRETTREDLENHLNFQKKLLADTEAAIKGMEKRLSMMKRRYEKQVAEKEQRLERRTQELIAENPPERLVKDAAGDFSRTPRKAPKKP